MQPKLTVNTPGDQFEQEADAMADRVMRMSSTETAKPVTNLIGKSLQRKCAHCEEEEKRKKPVMRKAEAGNAGVPVSSSFASSLNASKGSGYPLPTETRNFMENAFSTDFSEVKIHTGSKASEMNKGINAKAFTYGNDIYFKEGQYNPVSSEGKHLLAHELTHTVQQSDTASLSTNYIQRQDISDSTYNITLVYPPNHVERHQHVLNIDALRILGRFADRIAAHLEGGIEGHRFLIQQHNDQYIVAGISDLFGGVSLPSIAIWNSPRALVRNAREIIERGNIQSAASQLQQAAIQTRSAERQIYEYREGTISGAERTVFGLEVVQVASTAIVSVYTGGTAGILLGAGLTGTQRLAGEAMSVHLGLQDRIDWGGVVFDTLFAAIAGRFGSRLGGAVAVRLGGSIAAQAATALIVGRASGIVHAVARELFDALRGTTELTVDGFINQIAGQLTLRAAFLDLVGAAAGAASSRRPTTGQTAPARSETTTTRPRLTSVAGGDTRPITLRTDSQGRRVVATPSRTGVVGASQSRPTVGRRTGLAVAYAPEPVVTPRPVPELVPPLENVPVTQAQPEVTTASRGDRSSSSVSGAVAVSAAAGPASGSGRGEARESSMRHQIQRGGNHHSSLAVTDILNRGVTAQQLRETMLSNWNQYNNIASGSIPVPRGWTRGPVNWDRPLRSAIISQSQALNAIVAGGGVTQGGDVNSLRRCFNPRTLQPSNCESDDVRLDIENNGHNLRFIQ